jgi:formylglycine-generating enzyme required for sulfatase activity
MLLALKIKTVIVAAAFAASPMAVSVLSTVEAGHRQAAIQAPALVELKPGSARYFAAGEFTRDGKPVNVPDAVIRIGRPLKIMKHQVSVADYRRCIDDGACAPLPPEAATEPDRPAVMVSWRDATAYAGWLSRKLGGHYRLPTDQEWTFAAGSRAPDETPPVGDSGNAIARWLSRYERESRSQPGDQTPLAIGSFGVNENGLSDVAGNVWEWTDSCFTRSTLDGAKARVVTVNCGVRVVEGRHRTYMTDFIRDARAGGCAVGIPPSNLGFRLVRDSEKSWLLSFVASQMRRLAGRA